MAKRRILLAAQMVENWLVHTAVNFEIETTVLSSQEPLVSSTSKRLRTPPAFLSQSLRREDPVELSTPEIV